MTDEQINAAIDRIKGYDNYECRCDSCHPDWCNDLNAMHEAEKVLAPKSSNNFSENWWNYCKLVRVNGANEAIHATARQRAEAFLRALGKWEEVQG